jgi:hypothetical protein
MYGDIGCFSCSRSFLARVFSTLKMVAIHSSETSVHTRSTRRHIAEDGILLFLVNFVSYFFPCKIALGFRVYLQIQLSFAHYCLIYCHKSITSWCVKPCFIVFSLLRLSQCKIQKHLANTDNKKHQIIIV